MAFGGGDGDDALYCAEESGGIILNDTTDSVEKGGGVFLSILEEENDDDEEEEEQQLETLLSKEKESFIRPEETEEEDCGDARREAVEWVLKINTHYGFTSLTAVLAVNYLDRFLSSHSFQRDKQPWMMQLAAVACLSLAAKVEETYVPLLLDLQVEGARYLFEAKTIQRMELLVLSSLRWRMNPVTPLSFLDHIIRKLGLKSKSFSYPHFDFPKNCENLLLFILSDSRFRWCSPSVLATATLLHVVDDATGVDYEAQLVSMLRISKEEVTKCYQLISDKLSNTCRALKKRKTQSSVHVYSNDSAESSCTFF